MSFALKKAKVAPTKSAPAVPIVKALVNILLFIVINSHLPSLEIAIVHLGGVHISENEKTTPEAWLRLLEFSEFARAKLARIKSVSRAGRNI